MLLSNILSKCCIGYGVGSWKNDISGHSRLKEIEEINSVNKNGDQNRLYKVLANRYEIPKSLNFFSKK